MPAQNEKTLPMTTERLYLYDTTLRDGAQTDGVDFSISDKRAIAAMLDALGVDYIEGGYPGANPTDTEFFAARPALRSSRLAAFGMTKRAGRSVENDPGLRGTLAAQADAVCLVAKAWDFHVDVALGITNEENLSSIGQSVEAMVEAGRETIIDCEHFFDGYKSNPTYAIDCVRTALACGARWVVLCDTNGGTLPDEVHAIVTEVIAAFPGEDIGARLGIHAHNDTENAVANSLAAVDAGVRQIQGTLNGLGERCGNANLTTLIPTLLLKPALREKYHIGIESQALKQLTMLSRRLDEMLNRPSQRQAPYVGESAFATKAGIHASALIKNPETYEHVAPETVGNRRRVLVGDQAGRSNIAAALDAMGLGGDLHETTLTRLLEEVKRREARGYAFETAPASFELLARRTLGQVPHYFSVKSFRVWVERRHNAVGDLVTFSEAIVELTYPGAPEMIMSVARGNGPVNALDKALRKDLGPYHADLQSLSLVDYRVRIFGEGTNAVTRVLMESQDDATGDRWFTVGVSPNIIDASFEALEDAITLKLVREQAVPPRID